MEKMIKLTRQDLTFPQPSDGIYKHMKPKAVVVEEPPIRCHERVFRAEWCMDKEKLERTRLHGEYDLPTTQASPPEACVEWTWLTKEDAKEKVLNGESLFISGIGGTGKSYFMKELVK